VAVTVPTAAASLARRGVSATHLTFLALLGIGLVLGGSLATQWFPVTVCLVFGAAIIAIALFDPPLAVRAGLAFALVLGTARRWFDYQFPEGAHLPIDPMLAVPPLVTLGLFFVAVRRGALRDRSPLASAVLGLCLLGTVGALNPFQGSVVAWPLGFMIFMTPVLWFWIGRGLVDDQRMQRIMRMALVVAVASAAYGLLQTLGWFLSWDSQWIEDVSDTYVVIRIQSFIRGFGFASSAAEYGKLIGIGIVLTVAVLARRGRSRGRFLWMPLVAVLGAALFLSGLRTTLVLTVAAIGLVWGTRRGASPAKLVVLGVASTALLFLAVQLVTPGGDRGGAATTVLADRQISGLSDPFDPRASTLQTHIGLVGRSIAGAVTNPIGSGTATITIAGKRFGVSESGDTDLADAAIAFGILGIVIYLLVAYRLMRQAYRLARFRHDRLALAALGIVVVSSLQWLNGGLYAANMLAWLTFGWIDRASAAAERRQQEPRDAAPAPRGANGQPSLRPPRALPVR
jgi:hypothetical protein